MFFNKKKFKLYKQCNQNKHIDTVFTKKTPLELKWNLKIKEKITDEI